VHLCAWHQQVLIVDLACQGGLCVQTSHLVVNVVVAVGGHLHAAVHIVQRRVRHLHSLSRNRGNSSQIRLIALVLQNSLLALLDRVLLFKLSNHRVQEINLELLFLDLRLHLILDFRLHFPFELSIMRALLLVPDRFKGLLHEVRLVKCENFWLISRFLVLLADFTTHEVVAVANLSFVVIAQSQE